jgi:hypothetical protein
MKYHLLVFLALTTTNACLDKCECFKRRIECTNLTRPEFDQLFTELKSDVVYRVSITNCSTPLGLIESFPKCFRASSLDISRCGVTGFIPNAFKFFSNDLIDLTLSTNNLTSVSFLEHLCHLKMLFLQENSVVKVL